MILTLRTHSLDSRPAPQPLAKEFTGWNRLGSPRRKGTIVDRPVHTRFTMKQDMIVVTVLGLLATLATLRQLTRVFLQRSSPLCLPGL